MSLEFGIFVFTRDRPTVLKKGLESILDSQFRIIVIDDSVSTKNQTGTRDLVEGLEGCSYFGNIEYSSFRKEKCINLSKYSFLLRELGQQEWNLGFTRNLALLLSKSIGFDSVLFMDDDIQVKDCSLIKELFDALDKFSFTGANISGMIDDSIIGHLALDLDIHNPRLISGGFMAFKPININHYFLNIYNEDWIWLLFHLEDNQWSQFGDVYQDVTDPFSNWQKKLAFQEYGEIAMYGLMDLSLRKIEFKKNITSAPFWRSRLEKRNEFCELLKTKSIASDRSDYVQILDHMNFINSKFDEYLWTNEFIRYLTNQNDFLDLYSSIS